MLRKALPLLLAIWFLPACAALAPLFPSSQESSGGRVAEEDLYQKAENNYRHQAYRAAWQGYMSYLEQYPKGKYVPQARQREAELLGLMGDWQGSLAAYQRLLASQPEPDVALKARYGIGRAYFKLGQYQQASQILDNLTANPDLPRSSWFSTQALLCEIALKQGQVSQAFARLRLAAQDLPSGDQEWFEDLKTRVVDAATPEELENLATLYRDSPLSAALLLRLARLSQEAGRLEEARKWVATLKERFPNSPEALAADRLAARGKLGIGVLLPLSGEYSNIGTKVQRGMELAAKDAPVDLIFRDTHNDPAAAAQTVRDLAQNQGLAVILGPLTSAVAQSAADAAQASGMPLVALSQKGGLTQAGDFVFQAFITPRQQVRALVRHALGSHGFRRFAILYPDSAYGRTFAEQFQEEAEAQGGQVAARESYAPGTREFTPFLTSLEDVLKSQSEGSPGFQALFIPDDTATVAAIAGSLGESHWRQVQLLGTNLIHPTDLAEAQLKALDGIVFPEPFFPGDPNAAVQNFIAAYRQQYGMEPDYLATQGYVAVRLLVRLAETEKFVNRADLPRLLLSLKASPDLPWFRGFNSAREEEPSLYLLTIREGRVQMAQ